MSDQLLAFEHKVLRALNPATSGGRWLLAVSGGVDSMVMAEVLWRWRRKLDLTLAVAHVHHGFGENPQQNKFRNLAQARTEKWCGEHKVPFFTIKGVEQKLHCESELRVFRMRHLRRWFRGEKFERIAFAHHADDLLETRLLRLLRGSGAQGLKAMSVQRGNVVRPLLLLSRREIENYARAREIHFVEDPSNASSAESLRNWLRHEWLPQLEKRSPGVMKSFSRSLATLAKDEFTETIGPFVGLRRTALASASPSRREDIVARYLRTMGLRGYSQNHVQELLKRLGKAEKSLRFKMLGFSFQATPDFLWASRV